ncbi:MAG: type II toxin-antitoxin system HicA family toxin [Candidatus Omnitrophota bacterium]|nr:MAG: type II toxin-antitoxin system HicA family toxin [Candidatus Omnitrophota bacterium]
MTQFEKLLSLILHGESDSTIRFHDLCQLLRHFGFDERTRGSHHIFRKSGIEEKINLQCDGTQAKSYQVHQVRRIILKYKLGVKKIDV